MKGEHCVNCERGLTNYCLLAQPAENMAGAAYGFADMGPWQGGQAEYLRVPWADFNARRLPEGAEEKQDDYVMLADIFPTGWHATELAGVQPGETVVIYGGGPVGLMAAYAATIKGACKVIVVDRHPDRPRLAESIRALPIDDSKESPIQRVLDDTNGLGAHRGCQRMGTGQCPVKRYNRHLRNLIYADKAQPSFIVSHRLGLDEAPDAYERFDRRERLDGGRPDARQHEQRRSPLNPQPPTTQGVTVSNQLQGQRIAILAADGVERVELEQPRGALHGAGAQTELLSIHDGEIQARQMDLEPAATFRVDKLVSDATVDEYDALLLPGGAVNPDKLRMNEDAVAFVSRFADSGKPIAAICHAPWMLLEAGAVRGRRVTSWPSIRTDLRNAGAEVVDEEVVIDGPLTTSRSPADLTAFCPAIVEQFAHAHAHA